MAVEVARNRGRPWTRELDELLLELDDAGATREHIAQELGRTIAAVDTRLQELRQRIDDTPACRHCVYYAPSRQWCLEWSRAVAPEYHCGRYQSERGDGSPVRTYRLEEVEAVSDEELRKLERLVARVPRRLHAHEPVTDEWYGCFTEIRTAKERFKGSLVALTEPYQGETIVALLKAVPELLAEIRRLKALVAERERGEAS